jgi:FkbM family methyltransferase
LEEWLRNNREPRRAGAIYRRNGMEANMLQSPMKWMALKFLPNPLLLKMRKVHYLRKLRHHCEHLEPDLHIVKHLIRPGEVGIDLGANFGVYTKYLSDLVGSTGSVLSVEPIQSTFEVLTTNVKKLGLRNVKLVQAAISAEPGVVRMELPDYQKGGTNFYEARVVTITADDKGSHTVEVPASTLDQLTAKFDRLDFIKCDVEGHELACLSGAKELLSRFQPAWLIEVSGNPDKTDSKAHQLTQLLGKYGYAPYWFDRHHLRLRQPGDRSTNYFYLRLQHLERIPDGFLPYRVSLNAA